MMSFMGNVPCFVAESRNRYGFALATSRCTHFWYRSIPTENSVYNIPKFDLCPSQILGTKIWNRKKTTGGRVPL